MSPCEQARCEAAGKALATAQFLSDGKTPVAKALVDAKFGEAFFPEGLQLKTPSRSAEASGEAEGSETHR